MLRNLSRFPVASCARYSSSSSKRLDVAGIYPPIVAPFNEKGDILYDKLEHNFSVWKKTSLKGFVVHGTAGEYVYLSPEERVEMVKQSKQMVGSEKQIIAGSGCESTLETIKQTEDMAKAGADAVLVVTPCYYKGAMTLRALVKHYVAVADASPIPVLLYSVPSHTALELPEAAVRELAQHPNIIGMKDSGGNVSRFSIMLRQTANEDFQLLAGSASFLLPSLLIGCVGGVCAFANVLAQPVCDLLEAYQQGNFGTAVALHRMMIEPSEQIKKTGVAGIKAAVEWFGLYGGPPRLPQLPLSELAAQDLKQSFIRNGWLTE